jgi:hypothetical protein
MPDLPLGKSDYHRSVAKEARIQTRNRYYEANPVLTEGNIALIARPGLNRWIYVGSGPIRAVYDSPGDFDEALFVVSGTEWYRVDADGTVTFLVGGLNPAGFPSMAATGTIGETPEYLFMADGSILYLYMQNSYAMGGFSGAPAAGNTVRTDATYYAFTAGSVDTGAPDGTAAHPWLVALGLSTEDAWTNLGSAIAANGNPGTDYSTATAANPSVQPLGVEPTAIRLRSNAIGVLGNGETLAATGGLIASGATMSGGGTASVSQVETPNDVGPISIGYIASYVVVVPAQGEGLNGRFYWINPGETSIDELDFATAERAPDPVYNVIVFGDQFWLPGSTTTEVWYFTGNIDAPVQRLQGVTFDRGTIAGTALQVKESMIIVDSDGGVFQVAGGLNRISRPDIEERIREAIQYQAFAAPYFGS